MKLRAIFLFLMYAYAKAIYCGNPILPDFHADPSVHVWDGKYWIYPSTDEPGSTSWKQMKRWHCYSSTNLVDWLCEGEIFNLDSVSWAKNAAYAPDALKWNEKYYFFFPAGYQIGVAAANRPQGPYSDCLKKPLIKKNEVAGVESMDPCLFVDDDKTPYLYFGGHGGVAMVRLKNNLTEPAETPRKIDLQGYSEGIWVHKYKDTYYFTYPNEQTEKNKQVLVYCTATSPYGPYTYQGDFFRNNGRNSQHSIIQIKNKNYLFYHVEGNSPYERRVQVDYLNYDKNGRIQTVKMTQRGVKSIECPSKNIVK